MLREEVVDAVRQGRFHLWAVRTVDEGLQILAGIPAGEPDAERRYPEGTLNGRVAKRLEELAERLRRFSPMRPREDGATTEPVPAQTPEEGQR